MLVGLASKNAVLIVEFAKHKRETGMSRREATLEACRLRLRPILMTSFAFILGVVPLVWSTRAPAPRCGAPSGVAVFSGMLGVTFFGILLTPVFFSVIDWIGRFAGCSIRTSRIESVAYCSASSRSDTCGNCGRWSPPARSLGGRGATGRRDAARQ